MHELSSTPSNAMDTKRIISIVEQQNAESFQTPQNYCIGGTYLRTPPSPDGREYKLLIGLPYHYDENPAKSYPVLYLCDGYWDFMVILGLYGPLYSDRAIEEFIIVGLAYGSGYPDVPEICDRTTDLVPSGTETLTGPTVTPCERYLQSLTDTFAPFVEREYRTDPSRRVIAGCSIGGTFALLAMLRKPGFFASAIALSPCLTLGHDTVPRLEREYRRRQGPRNWRRLFSQRPKFAARLFMAVGGADEPSVIEPAKAFDRLLRGRHYAGFERQFWIAPEETHASVKGEGFNRGLRYVFGAKTGPNKSISARAEGTRTRTHG